MTSKISLGSPIGMAPTQITGMTGVYLAAAELSHLGFVVSPTSRSAKGADLLVTDQSCLNTWSVQVKTNAQKKGQWTLNEGDSKYTSNSHIYVFVNIMGDSRPEYLVVSSKHVAENIKRAPHSTRCWFNKGDGPRDGEGWELFGSPIPLKVRRGNARKSA
jgi:hypothetical protein